MTIHGLPLLVLSFTENSWLYPLAFTSLYLQLFFPFKVLSHSLIITIPHLHYIILFSLINQLNYIQKYLIITKECFSKMSLEYTKKVLWIRNMLQELFNFNKSFKIYTGNITNKTNIEKDEINTKLKTYRY
ncbi:hypothetical protein H8356DRAFT_1356640 [Neocallimastix lanati (nom. inval.)]|nr:hypothetical protein H8356DRAFT_1356640 [Neocallimastix sp. JGI-2020a]